MTRESKQTQWLRLSVTCLFAVGLIGCGQPPPPPPSVEDVAEDLVIEFSLDEPQVERPEAKPAAEEPAAEEPAVEEPAEPAADSPGIATDPKGPISRAELLIELPAKHNTPDALCLLPNGDIIVSVPNVNNREFPPALLRIKPDNTYEPFYELPPHPETGETFPFGMAVCPDGDLYVADLQWFANPEEPGHRSRVMWIPMTDGKPGEAKTIIEGLVVANAVLIRDGFVYVSDTTMKPGTQPLVSGVFRFPLEAARQNTIRVTQPLEDDPHCIGTIESHNDVGFGADGLAMDPSGNLYVGNFADGTVHKIEFETDGTPKPPSIFARAPFMKSCDGLFYDPQREVIFVADMLANAVQLVFLDGTVRTLAQDPAGDGSGGRLSAPSEAIVRGNEVIVCNFDMVIPGGVNQEFGPPHTISVIKLPESLRD